MIGRRRSRSSALTSNRPFRTGSSISKPTRTWIPSATIRASGKCSPPPSSGWAWRRSGGVARVFLSYAREDADVAKQLAQAVGAAGHEVWWDEHIHGGSRFTSAIDQALKNAEAVIVIWSPA